jgi:hypothetical protein
MLASPAIRRRIRVYAEPITISRRQADTSEQYGNGPTYSELPSERDIFVAGLEESRQLTDAGERQGLRTVAYTGPNVDLQVNDRFDHGPDTYEVLTKEGRPDEADPVVYRYELNNV